MAAGLFDHSGEIRVTSTITMVEDVLEPYLLRERQDIPINGSRLTHTLLESKLREHRIKATTTEVKEGDVINAGPAPSFFLPRSAGLISTGRIFFPFC